MKHSAIARFAGVSASDVSNYLAATERGWKSREKYVSPDKRDRIAAVLALSKTRIVEMHLETGAQLTPAYAFENYSLHSLGQRIGELNRRYEREGAGRHIQNLAPRGAGVHAVYQMVLPLEETLLPGETR